MESEPAERMDSSLVARRHWTSTPYFLLAISALAVLGAAGVTGFVLGVKSHPASGVMLIPGQPVSVKVARYGSQPLGLVANTTPWTPEATVTVSDRSLVTRLAGDANALPAFPSGSYACPADDGSHYEIQFFFANGDRRTLFAGRQGCEGVGFEDAGYGSNPAIAWSLTDQRLLKDLDAVFRVPA